LLFASGAHAPFAYRKHQLDRSGKMINTNSPLEHLASFAITFAAGALATVLMSKYIDKVRRDALAASACGH
jgi:hypothetical protein